MTDDHVALAEIKAALEPAVAQYSKPGEEVDWPALVRQVVADWQSWGELIGRPSRYRK